MYLSFFALLAFIHQFFFSPSLVLALFSCLILFVRSLCWYPSIFHSRSQAPEGCKNTSSSYPEINIWCRWLAEYKKGRTFPLRGEIIQDSSGLPTGTLEEVRSISHSVFRAAILCHFQCQRSQPAILCFSV